MRFLRQSGVVEILLYMLQHPEGVQKTDMRHELKLNPYSGVEAHKTLEELGIFEKKFGDENRILFALNAKGKKIAYTLFLMNDLVQDQFTVDFQDPGLVEFLAHESARRIPKEFEKIKGKKKSDQNSTPK